MSALQATTETSPSTSVSVSPLGVQAISVTWMGRPDAKVPFNGFHRKCVAIFLASPRNSWLGREGGGGLLTRSPPRAQKILN
eukprot:3330468-Rhodomonas_salina.2